MRRKLIATLVSACALAGILVGPASASAETLTLNNALEEPASAVWFPNGTGLEVKYWNGPDCETFEMETEITENAADPVTLELTGANLSGCEWQSGPVKFSEIEFPYPMALNADGTGALFLRVKEELPWWTCVREGVINLTYSEGVVSGFGYMQPTYLYSHCPTWTWEVTFGAAQDENGLIDWVITP